MANYRGDPSHRNEEYTKKLSGFTLANPPVTVAELKRIADNSGIVFCQTIVGLAPESGRTIRRYLEARSRARQLAPILNSRPVRLTHTWQRQAQ